MLAVQIANSRCPDRNSGTARHAVEGARNHDASPCMTVPGGNIADCCDEVPQEVDRTTTVRVRKGDDRQRANTAENKVDGQLWS